MPPIQRFLSPSHEMYEIFHQSFRDFLQETLEVELDEYRNHLIEQIKDWSHCEGWRKAYTLTWLPEHLLDAKHYNDLFTLAHDRGYQRAQSHTFPDNPALPLNTLQIALKAAIETDNAQKMSEFLLAHAWQVIATIQRENPLEALRKSSLERALKLADLYKIEQCIQWYLLLVWELHDTMRSDEARATLIRLCHKNLPRLHDEDNANAAELLAYTYVIDEFSFWDLCQRIIGDYIELCEALIRQRNFAAALKAAKQIVGFRADGQGRTEGVAKNRGRANKSPAM